MLQSLGDVQVIPRKTCLVCVARVRFAGLYPRKTGFKAGFALRRWLKHPRIVKTADYGPRWRGHYIDIRSEDDLDEQLQLWLRNPTTRSDSKMISSSWRRLTTGCSGRSAARPAAEPERSVDNARSALRIPIVYLKTDPEEP